MILKSFEKVNVECRNEYVVFDQYDNYIETFHKDYLNKDNAISNECERDWDKLEQYGKATVCHVSYNRARQCMSITLIAKI